jgi:hypothetical protein
LLATKNKIPPLLKNMKNCVVARINSKIIKLCNGRQNLKQTLIYLSILKKFCSRPIAIWDLHWLFSLCKKLFLYPQNSSFFCISFLPLASKKKLKKLRSTLPTTQERLTENDVDFSERN